MEFYSMEVSPGHLARAPASASAGGAACAARTAVQNGCGGDSPNGPLRQRRRHSQRRRRHWQRRQWRRLRRRPGRAAKAVEGTRGGCCCSGGGSRGGGGGGGGSRGGGCCCRRKPRPLQLGTNTPLHPHRSTPPTRTACGPACKRSGPPDPGPDAGPPPTRPFRRRAPARARSVSPTPLVPCHSCPPASATTRVTSDSNNVTDMTRIIGSAQAAGTN